MEYNGVQIKRATKEDIPAIMEITQEAFTQYQEIAGVKGGLAALSETPEIVEREIAEKIVLIATTKDNFPVGSLRLTINEDHSAYLSRFGVRVKYQGTGVGKALMQETDRLMAEHNVKKLCLHTASKAHSLMRFYFGCGFYVDSTSKDRGYIRAHLCKDYE
jgi:ribosomal protein S18 acetylase RimI-like enzyme